MWLLPRIGQAPLLLRVERVEHLRLRRKRRQALLIEQGPLRLSLQLRLPLLPRLAQRAPLQTPCLGCHRWPLHHRVADELRLSRWRLGLALQKRVDVERVEPIVCWVRLLHRRRKWAHYWLPDRTRQGLPSLNQGLPRLQRLRGLLVHYEPERVVLHGNSLRNRFERMRQRSLLF